MIFNQDGFYRTIIEHSIKKQKYFGGKSFVVNHQANENLFAYNGIVQKIISSPAEDALRAGFLLKNIDDETQENLFSILEDLESNKIFATALSWDRLQGGGAILMLIDDGKNLIEPVDENKIREIEKLEVYSPEDIIPQTFYTDPANKKFSMPETYSIINYFGNSFEVHETRLLIFHGGIISNQLRRARNGWGGTVIEQISDTLSHYEESLRLSIAALEKLSQDVMKLDGMKNVMQTDFGEEQIQKRLQLIDMYKHMENTIAIDTADEFDRKNLSLSGVKDIIEQAEYALSAATGIPSTMLFGRSPAGMNSTGKSDMENYYNLVKRIQERTLRPNLMRLVYLISLSSEYNLKFSDEWTIEFNPLWNPSEKEKAETEKIIAETQSQRANMFKILHELGVMDVSEIREELSKDFRLDMSLDKILAGDENDNP